MNCNDGNAEASALTGALSLSVLVVPAKVRTRRIAATIRRWIPDAARAQSTAAALVQGLVGYEPTDEDLVAAARDVARREVNEDDSEDVAEAMAAAWRTVVA